MATLLFRYRPTVHREPSPEPRPLPEPDEEANAAEVKRDRWWYESSYDLRSGLDVDDDVACTLPGDLLDELFRR